MNVYGGPYSPGQSGEQALRVSPDIVLARLPDGEDQEGHPESLEPPPRGHGAGAKEGVHERGDREEDGQGQREQDGLQHRLGVVRGGGLGRFTLDGRGDLELPFYPCPRWQPQPGPAVGLNEGHVAAPGGHEVAPLAHDQGDKVDRLRRGHHVGELIRGLRVRAVPEALEGEHHLGEGHPVLPQEHEEEQEREKGLQHPNHGKAVEQQLPVQQGLLLGVPRGAGHQVQVRRLVHQRQVSREVCAHADHDHQERGQRHRDPQEHCRHHRQGLAELPRRKYIHHNLLQVVEQAPPLLDSRHNGAKVILQQDHICGLPSDLRPGAHCHPHIGLLQRRGVVDAIPCNGDDLARPLALTDDKKLLLRAGPRKHYLPVSKGPVPGLVGEALQLMSRNDHRAAIWRGPQVGVSVNLLAGHRDDPYLRRNSCRGCRVVPGDHHDADAGLAALCNGLGHGGPGRVQHCHQSQEGHLLRGEVQLRGVVRRRELRNAQRAVADANAALAHSTEELHSLGNRGLQLRGQREGPAVLHSDGAAPLQHVLRGPFQYHQPLRGVAPLHGMHCGHELHP
eukprot:RCo015890